MFFDEEGDGREFVDGANAEGEDGGGEEEAGGGTGGVAGVEEG